MIDQCQQLIHTGSRRIQRIQNRQSRTTQIQIPTHRELTVIRTGCRPTAVHRELNRTARRQVTGDRHQARLHRPLIRHITRNRARTAQRAARTNDHVTTHGTVQLKCPGRHCGYAAVAIDARKRQRPGPCFGESTGSADHGGDRGIRRIANS